MPLRILYPGYAIDIVKLNGSLMVKYTGQDGTTATTRHESFDSVDTIEMEAARKTATGCLYQFPCVELYAEKADGIIDFKTDDGLGCKAAFFFNGTKDAVFEEQHEGMNIDNVFGKEPVKAWPSDNSDDDTPLIDVCNARKGGQNNTSKGISSTAPRAQPADRNSKSSQNPSIGAPRQKSKST
jgi:hypothetical protein